MIGVVFPITITMFIVFVIGCFACMSKIHFDIDYSSVSIE